MIVTKEKTKEIKGTRKEKLLSLLITFLILSVVVSILTSATENGRGDYNKTPITENTDKYTFHDPIYINGNSDFTSANGVTGGSGIETDPYIIEGWDINASTANGIEIRNTNMYFIIRNCVIHDGNKHEGVYFNYVTNGKIEGCEIYNNDWDGIYLYYSSHITITNSPIHHNCWHGIALYFSPNNDIHYCNIHDNTYYGIYNHNPEEEYRVNATYNYWGSPDGPSGSGSGSGEGVSDYVDYDPWLTKPVKISEEKPEDSILKILYLPIVAIIFVIIIAIVVGIVRRRKNKKMKEETKEITLEKTMPIMVKCPYCNTSFQTTPTVKPFKVKCPNCSKSSLLR